MSPAWPRRSCSGRVKLCQISVTAVTPGLVRVIAMAPARAR